MSNYQDRMSGYQHRVSDRAEALGLRVEVNEESGVIALMISNRKGGRVWVAAARSQITGQFLHFCRGTLSVTHKPEKKLSTQEVLSYLEIMAL